VPYLPLPPARAAARAPVLTANWGRCRFNKDVEVKAHHGNIKDKQFGVPYMKQFDLVFNALDNVGEPTPASSSPRTGPPVCRQARRGVPPSWKGNLRGAQRAHAGP
jgi:hypothetical protein